MDEFEIINTYFKPLSTENIYVQLGIGDDAALLKNLAKHNLVCSVDTLIEDVHYPKKLSPYDIGYRAIATALSDLAAMGSTPVAIMLALTLPRCDPSWIQAFIGGCKKLLDVYKIPVIGGNLTHGNTNITVNVFGRTPNNKAILRSNACVGDLIWISGDIGGASAGLKLLLQPTGKKRPPPKIQKELIARFCYPTPRIELGLQLRHIASSAIDISDGLMADVQHLLDSSKVGGEIHIDHLPISSIGIKAFSKKTMINFALGGGDDYELCFTTSAKSEHQVNKIAQSTQIPLTIIGHITKKTGLKLIGDTAQRYKNKPGYQHF